VVVSVLVVNKKGKKKKKKKKGRVTISNMSVDKKHVNTSVQN
jgi:hypothetical protein